MTEAIILREFIVPAILPQLCHDSTSFVSRFYLIRVTILPHSCHDSTSFVSRSILPIERSR